MAKKPPFEFVLEELADLMPIVKPMFGAYGVYVGGKMVVIMRDRETYTDDNGIWIATKAEHHATLKQEFPTLHSIYLFDSGETNWQVLPVQDENFEEDAFRICSLIRKGDPRIGSIPKARSKKKKPAKKSSPVKKKTVKKKSRSTRK